MPRLSFVLVLFCSLLSAEIYQKVENTNFTIHEKNYTYNYDRLRLRLDWQDQRLFATVIADGVNYLGEEYTDSEGFVYNKLLRSNTPFKTQTNYTDYNGGSAYAKLYRAYAGYEDGDNRVVAGLQNISMGVGRIWQVTNIYNPKNIYALEPDETYGVAGVLYTRYLSATSNLSAVISLDRNDEPRYALRYKSFLDVADVALDLVSDKSVNMVGYELEGSEPSSGIGLRSEGAYFDTNSSDFFQGIVGVDYGFENGVTLIAEALYSSKIFTNEETLKNYESAYLQNIVGSHYFTALSLSYPINIYLDTSCVYIEGFDGEKSRFFSPQFTYTLNDYNSFTVGMMLYDQGTQDLDRYFFKWLFSF
ncbi:MAG: hypothetical protein ABXS93_03570 [Sulfurimonas sp.]